MLAQLWPVRARAALACVLLVLSVAAEITAVRLVAEAVNRVAAAEAPRGSPPGLWQWLHSGDPDARALLSAAGGLALCTAIVAGLSFARELANARFSLALISSLRAALYDRLQRLGSAFHDRNASGALISRSLSDLQNVRAFLNTALLTSLEIVLITAGYIALLLTRSPWLALLALLPLPLWTWYVLWFSRKSRVAQQAVLQAGDENVAILTENLSGAAVVRAFAAQQREIKRYGAQCETYLARILDRARLHANFTPVVRSIGSAAHLLMFLAAGVGIIYGVLRAGDVLMLGAAMGAVLGRLQQVALLYEQSQNAAVSAVRLHEILAAAPGVAEQPGARELPPGRGALHFEHVTFGYDPARPVLHDVSFALPGGGVIAVMGPTGAGKSTLAQLAARLYDPQAGRVLLDGMDLQHATLATTRAAVSMVFQESYLFSESLRANVAYRTPDADDALVHDAAHAAQALPVAKDLPDDWDTIIGERGATLSGGQRQRVAIARALLGRPRLLILDDATAALDSETELRVLDGLRRCIHGRTLLIVTHRVSTARLADEILVLENGRVSQRGRHDDLLGQPGYYASIAADQSPVAAERVALAPHGALALLHASPPAESGARAGG